MDNNQTLTPADDALNTTMATHNIPIVGMTGPFRFVYLTIGAIGFIGNLIVVMVIFGLTSMRKKLTNLFIVHQSIIDMATSFFLVAFTLTTGRYFIPGILGDFLCRIWVSAYMLWLLFVTSSYNLMALTLERYLGIVHPILHRTAFTRNKAFIIMAGSWVFGILINCFSPITSGLDEQMNCLIVSIWPSPQIRRATGIANFILKYFIPIGTMIYCYGHIIYVLHNKNKARLNTQHSQEETHDPSRNAGQPNMRTQKATMNVIKILVIVCLCFIFCWSWNQFFFILANFGVAVRFDTAFYEFSVIAVFANCCINPIIYMLKYDEFKKAIRKLFLRQMSKIAPASSDTGGSGGTTSSNSRVQ